MFRADTKKLMIPFVADSFSVFVYTETGGRIFADGSVSGAHADGNSVIGVPRVVSPRARNEAVYNRREEGGRRRDHTGLDVSSIQEQLVTIVIRICNDTFRF